MKAVPCRDRPSRRALPLLLPALLAIGCAEPPGRSDRPLSRAASLMGAWGALVSPPVGLLLRLVRPAPAPEPAPSEAADPTALVGAYQSPEVGSGGSGGPGVLLILDAGGGATLRAGDEHGPVRARGRWQAGGPGLALVSDAAGEPLFELRAEPAADGERFSLSAPRRAALTLHPAQPAPYPIPKADDFGGDL